MAIPNQDIMRLAALSQDEYDDVRKDEAKQLNARLTTLDKLVREQRALSKKSNEDTGRRTKARVDALFDKSQRDANQDENWRSLLKLDPKGNPRPTLANAIAALSQCPDWQGVLAFDEMRQRTVVRKDGPPVPWSDQAPGLAATGQDWSDLHDVRTTEWLSSVAGIDVKPTTVADAVQAVAIERSFHPVRDYLKSLHWDGIDRLNHWVCDNLGVEDTNYAREVGAKWMISAVARVMRPGCKADHMLILEGRQGKFKSTALRTLVGSEWFSDEISDFGSKDAAMQTAGVWVIEVGELTGMSKADIKQVKSFMSRQVDRYRPPYGRRVIDQPRQSIMAGSDNGNDYLVDETGNRRFWPVACVDDIDIENLRLNRDNLWAEAFHRFNAGESWWLEGDVAIASAEAEQAARYHADEWQTLIAEFITGKAEVTVADILRDCLRVGEKEFGRIDVSKWTQADQNRVARCLRALGWQHKQVRKSGIRYRAYLPPEA